MVRDNDQLDSLSANVIESFSWRISSRRNYRFLFEAFASLVAKASHAEILIPVRKCAGQYGRRLYNPRFAGGFHYGSFSITINDSNYIGPNGPPGSYWNLGSDIDRVTILLHELSHGIADRSARRC